MKKTKFRKLLPILLAVLVVIGIGAGAAGYARARYRTQIMKTGETTWKTQLASGFTLVMNDTTMEADGAYTAGTAEVTEGSNYLIPGTVVPRIPVLHITGKSDVPCYLYVEVLADNEEGLASCELTDDWTLLEGVRGMDGGDVYIYRNGEVLTSEIGSEFSVAVLKDGVRADRRPAGQEAELSFCGYLLQVTEGTAAEIFRQKTANR